MFAAYEKTPDGEWVGVHRHTLDEAIFICKQYQTHNPGCAVAVVPDNVDPIPYFQLAEGTANIAKLRQRLFA